MKWNLLASTLALSILSTSAFAQTSNTRAGTYDDRWYLTFGAGANQQDSSRDTENAAFGTVGVGKFINPNWSIDTEINYQNPKANRDEDLNFSQYGISVDARRHFRKEGRLFNPYIVGGVGYQWAEEEYDNFPNPDSPAQSKRSYPTAKLGVGVQGDFNRVSVRGEIAARHSFDDESVVAPDESGFTDALASVSVLIPLGARTVAQATPAPVVVTEDHSCHRDTDNDGVMDCHDACPSVEGQVVGDNGCPVPLVIDLRGVHFDFDQSTLRADSQDILDEAVEILRRNSSLKVQVAGHTDLCGSEDYNQDLSERRAQAVYNYLIAQGVSANQLSGPYGFGESSPLEATSEHYPECRSELNRRTELNVEN